MFKEYGFGLGSLSTYIPRKSMKMMLDNNLTIPNEMVLKYGTVDRHKLIDFIIEFMYDCNSSIKEAKKRKLVIKYNLSDHHDILYISEIFDIGNKKNINMLFGNLNNTSDKFINTHSNILIPEFSIDMVINNYISYTINHIGDRDYTFMTECRNLRVPYVVAYNKLRNVKEYKDALAKTSTNLNINVSTVFDICTKYVDLNVRLFDIIVLYRLQYSDLYSILDSMNIGRRRK